MKNTNWIQDIKIRDPETWVVKSVVITGHRDLINFLFAQSNYFFEFLVRLSQANRLQLQEIAQFLHTSPINIYTLEKVLLNIAEDKPSPLIESKEFIVEISETIDDETTVTLACKREHQKNAVTDWLFNLFKENPEPALAEGLRRFKALIEVGEVATTDGQSVGEKGTKEEDTKEDLQRSA